MKEILRVSHHGVTFVAYERGPNNILVWPIKEYLIRKQHSRNVAERIEKMNPEGKEEGFIPRGWHPHHRFNHFMMCTIGPRDFIRKYGRERYRLLPKEAFVRNGHRKAIQIKWTINNAFHELF